MNFMVQFSVKPGNKNKALDAFDNRGPNRNSGVTFRGGWIGAHSDVVFALVESSDESLVNEVARSWSELGEFRITEVVDVDQF
jgi:hypothetical protein